jgi:hypothetical protein
VAYDVLFEHAGLAWLGIFAGGFLSRTRRRHCVHDSFHFQMDEQQSSSSQYTSTVETEKTVDIAAPPLFEQNSSKRPSRNKGLRDWLPGPSKYRQSNVPRDMHEVKDNDDPQPALYVELERKIKDLNEEKEKLIRQSNTLAQESHNLKTHLEIESEEQLKSRFHDLHNHIRSWCQRFYETKRRRPDARLPPLPVTSPDTYYSVDRPDEYRVVYGIACAWELLVDCIFQHPLGLDWEDKLKDLWTTRCNAEAINCLEKSLACSGTSHSTLHLPSC